MCSLEYLSKKAVLTDKLHKIQHSLLEYRKDYECILKDNATENEKIMKLNATKIHLDGVLSNEDAEIRNKSIIDNLVRLEKEILQSIKKKNTKLNNFQNKKIYETNQISHSLNNVNQTDTTTALNIAKNENIAHNPSVQRSHEKVEEADIKFDIIPIQSLSTPQKHSTIITQDLNETISPKVSPRIHYQKEQKIVKDSIEVQPMISPRFRDSGELLNLKDSVEGPPTISPRIRDSRERMTSPSRSQKPVSEIEIHNVNNDDSYSGKYVNIDNEYDRSKSSINFDQYLNIFLLIRKKLTEINRNYRSDYLEAVKNNQSSSVEEIESHLKSFFSIYGRNQFIPCQIDLQDLIGYLFKTLPRFSNGLKFDESTISIIGKINNDIKFEDLNKSIRNKICLTNEIENLWNSLVEHFDKLVLDKFLSNQEINQLFTTLFMSLPQTNCKEGQMSTFLDWLLNVIEEKNKIETIDLDSVHNITLFSDEDSTNTSHTNGGKKMKEAETAVITYDHLKNSLNLSHFHGDSSEDDDPNDDINQLFTSSINKSSNVGNAQTNKSQEKLIRSIKNIDDDFISEDLSHHKKEPEKQNNDDDDDDDFDFYR